MTYKTIILEVSDGVATLTLNRPDKLNALSPTLLQEAAGAIQELNNNDDIKALIITGAGKGFCSGADLTEPVTGSDMKQPGIGRRVRLEPFVSFGWLIKQIDQFAKPTIAAVNGIAAGGGLGIALACDIRIAAESARFASVFVKRGLVPDCGVTFYLPRLVGLSKALELMWSGSIISAQEAKNLGMVNQVIPADKLSDMARNFGLMLARGPSVAIELTKRLVYEGLKTDSILSQLAQEDSAQSVCRQTDDVKEGVAAFLEKREPRFSGT